MPLIRIEKDGKVLYRKPSKDKDSPYYRPGGYEPARRNMNHWYFADMSTNISEQVWAIGQAYNQRIKEEKIRHMNAYPVQLLRYFYFLYLTGSRCRELVCEPAPRITISNTLDKVYLEVQKVNEKHMAPDGQGRDVIPQALPVFNKAEQNMWMFITDGGMMLDASEIFETSKWKSLSSSNLNCLIKSNFRTNLRDNAGKLHKNIGITPHILRHMRAYNLIVNYGAEPPYVIQLFGWKDQRMLYYYAHIRNRLGLSNQLEMLKRGKLLTDLRIDLGKVVSQYY